MQRHQSHGFSFIEVLISLGLLAMTLISMTSLFSAGQHQVRSGGASTEALSVARSILEEMEGWGYRQTYLAYGLDGSTTSSTVDTKTNSYAAKWQPLLDARLADSVGEIRISSLPSGGSTPIISAATGLRVAITIRWSEGRRVRSVELLGVKI